MTNDSSVKKLADEISKFVAERDWAQFHSPKNLAISLSIESAELLEIFQWLTPEQSNSAEHVNLRHLREEIGDVMIYLTTLAKKFKIDPVEAALEKIAINKEKYPVEKSKGKAQKYTNYQIDQNDR